MYFYVLRFNKTSNIYIYILACLQITEKNEVFKGTGYGRKRWEKHVVVTTMSHNVYTCKYMYIYILFEGCFIIIIIYVCVLLYLFYLTVLQFFLKVFIYF